MRSPMRLENVIKTEEEEGSHTELWVAFVSTRGYFKKRSGIPVLEGDAVQKLLDEYDCWCYWRSAMEGNMSVDTRIVYDNKVFRIITWNRLNEDRRFMYFKLVTSNEY